MESVSKPRLVPPSEPAEHALYEIRRKIYPRAVTGKFALSRWIFVWATQLVFYGLPWVAWNDRQAVLFDLANRKFYIFGLVFWPQDVIYLTVLLIISAYALFLFTAVAGRLWCGYACPQTVYTEIFMWIERVIEGDRMKRMKLDQSALSGRKAALKTAKHAIWIGVALWTGFTFVGYFTPITTLAQKVAGFGLGPWETFWILFYGFATYGNAGWMREQVCKYMCPYARFQSVMFDSDTMVISYDSARGEARGARARGADYKAKGLGDCVDCGICVQVCPTGIDIRNGLQYECIGCAACIDGCNRVMDKMGYPRGLIRYATESGLKKGYTAAQMIRRVFRPRVLIYTAVLWIVILAAGFTLVQRVPIKVDVIRDRVTASRADDPVIENVYRLQVMNTSEQRRAVRIEAAGIEDLEVASEPQPIEIGPASQRAVPVRLSAEREHVRSGSNAIVFTVKSVQGSGEEVVVTERAVFVAP